MQIGATPNSPTLGLFVDQTSVGIFRPTKSLRRGRWSGRIGSEGGQRTSGGGTVRTVVTGDDPVVSVVWGGFEGPGSCYRPLHYPSFSELSVRWRSQSRTHRPHSSQGQRLHTELGPKILACLSRRYTGTRTKWKVSESCFSFQWM